MQRLAVSFLAFVLLTSSGCGPGKPLAGTVTGSIKYNGQPVNGGFIHLHPTAGGPEASPYVMPLGQDGTFQSADVPLGDYKVVLQPSKGTAAFPVMPGMTAEQKKTAQENAEKAGLKAQPPTIKIPAKYTNVKTSDLTVSIKPGQQKLDLELKD